LTPGVPCRPHDSAAGRRGNRRVVDRQKRKPDAPMLEGNSCAPGVRMLVTILPSPCGAKRPEAVILTCQCPVEVSCRCLYHIWWLSTPPPRSG
jgi:hypothetical protein